ncbi:MAG: hypothetical protein ACODAA_03970, partial [Gemmatimonadota bacterium]
ELAPPELVSDVVQIAAASRTGESTILDARPPARFRGDVAEPRPGLRAGHIPGARNVHYTALLNTDGTMKDAAVLRAAVHREISLTAVSPLGRGESWHAAWRWWRNRPTVRFGVSAPAEIGRPAVIRVEATGERETHASVPDAATSGEEERASAAIEWSSWFAPAFRATLRGSFDRWRNPGSATGEDPDLATPSEAYLRAGATGELRLAGDRLRFVAGTDRWAPLGAGAAFGTASVRVEAISRTRPEGVVVSGRLYLRTASREAPRTVWPGAGTGIARPELLRAHPLLEDGVIDGRAFDRRLGGGGIELTRWLPTGGVLRVGGAAFLDAARAWSEGPGVSLADAGIGLRLTTAGGGPTLRLDLATGLSDDEWALSLGWADGD